MGADRDHRRRAGSRALRHPRREHAGVRGAGAGVLLPAPPLDVDPRFESRRHSSTPSPGIHPIFALFASLRGDHEAESRGSNSSGPWAEALRTSACSSRRSRDRSGDFSTMYGQAGYLLFFFRKRKDLTLKIWATFGYFFLVVLMGIASIVTTRRARSSPRPPRRRTRLRTGELADGTCIQQCGPESAENWGFFPFMSMNILGLFLFGVLAWRRGFFQPAPESLPRYRRANGSMLPVVRRARRRTPRPPAPACPALRAAALARFALQTSSTPARASVTSGRSCSSVTTRAGRRGSIGSESGPHGPDELSAPVGHRHPPLLQLLPRALRPLRAAVLLIPTVLIFAAQVWMSVWWLERFRYGPAEWVWRSLTYRKLQPFVRDDRAPLLAQPAA